MNLRGADEVGADRAASGRARTGLEEPALSVPAVAPLELDELLDQLIDRARELKATQCRLRGLLAATITSPPA